MAATQIASLFAKITADTSAFERDMKSVKGDLNASEKSSAALGNSLKLAMGIGVTAVAGLATGIGVATKSAANMEQQIANIRAIMGLTAEQTDQLQKLIMDLGVDPKLKVSAVEAAAAIEMLGRNGLSMTQIMDGAARSTVLLANSTGADFATAADLATDVMALFNIEAADMAKAVDGITGVTMTSKFSVDDYRLALAQGGGVAASVGVTFEDFNATIAAISPLFASGSDAGTSFKVFLQRLVPQSSAAAEMMHELGLEFFDGAGKMKSMEDIAGQLSRAFSGLSEDQKLNAASTMFGTDAMRAAFGLASSGREDILRLKAAIGNVSAEESAAVRMDTFAGTIEILKGVMETLTIQVGSAFLPVFRTVAEMFTELASTYGPRVVEWAGRFAERLGAMVSRAQEWVRVGMDVFNRIMEIVDLVINGIAPLTAMIGKWFGWKDIMTAVAVILGGVVLAAIAGFIAAIAPVAVVIGGVTLAVATLRNAWERDWGGIQGKTEAAKEYLTERFGVLGAAIRSFGGLALKELAAWATGQEVEFAAAKLIWVEAKLAFGKVWEDTKRVLGEWGTKITEWVGVVFAAFAERFPGAAAKMQEAWDRTKETVGRFWDVVKPLIDKAIEWFKKLVTAWQTGNGEMVDSIEKAKEFIDGILTILVTVVETFINNAIDAMTLIIQFLSGDWAGAWETAKRMFDRTLNAFKDIATVVLGIITSTFGVTLEDIKRIVGNLSEQGRALVNNIWNGVKETWSKFSGWLKEQFDKLPDPIKNMVKAAVSWGRDLIQGFWDGIRNKWGEFWGWIQTKWSELTNGFKRFFGISSPSKLFMRYGEELSRGLALGVEQSMPRVEAAIGDMGSTVNVIGDAVGGPASARGGDDLAAAIRQLVSVLQGQRSGNQINVTMPGATGNNANDLAATVQYLQALYA